MNDPRTRALLARIESARAAYREAMNSDLRDFGSLISGFAGRADVLLEEAASLLASQPASSPEYVGRHREAGA